MKKILFLLSCLVMFLSQDTQSQEKAYDLDDLIGVRASSSENAIEDRGYDLIKVDKSSDQIYQYWWNDRKNRCAIVRISDGKVRSAVRAPDSDCEKGRYSNSNNRDRNRRGDRDYVEYKDLEGEMATRAYDRLERRGFREGKNHSNDGKTYRVWYNNRTDQCIKTLSVNKRIKEIMESNRCD